ncbi:MAG TPA: alcohol dehydrogenase-like regulatory protein ErcA [Tepidisphaeraceae bacterium]|nr:alcohol dehydrogenase-like regulatory protein ErcA [Tepidisphaeraceae bacterium]
MKSLQELRKFVAPEFVYGPGALRLAGRCAKSLAATKVMIVTDPGVRVAGWTKQVEASVSAAGLPYVVFDAVTPNPKDHEVMAGAEVYKAEHCDLILSVGGGSPTDCAKGIGISAANAQHVLEFEGIDAVRRPGPPLLCIPTTAGTAADLSQFAIITDTTCRRKIAIISKMVVPDASLVDPLSTTTMTPELTAATGLDVLCHAFEAYSSNLSSPVTDINALEAARLVGENLAGAYAEPANLGYRDAMMTASLMAGLAFSNASLGLVHAMAHSLGGFCDLPHGDCNAILLEHVVRFNFEAVPERYSRLARALGVGTPGESGGQILSALVGWLAALRKSLGIAPGLGAMGVARRDLSELAARASSDPCLATNPRPASVEDIERLYEAAF